MSSEKPVLAPGSASLTDREAPTPPPAAATAAAPPGSGQQVVTGSVTGDMMVSGSGAVVLPAGVINPSVPIRNIKMKFAVLIGLIQVGEVSNRDIVETVLNLASFLAVSQG
ncbi:neurobeachin-like isoform X7 [Labeo rohita]|uniref:Neurobeachin-like isoform X7 n=1 Tax=Labeo rohita TaxID=84645 RepID=A0A498L7G7_LABRO|nr:neurobeachin-like isoform X7 [Labeo rohita]